MRVLNFVITRLVPQEWKIKYQAEKEMRKWRRDDRKAEDRAERASVGNTGSRHEQFHPVGMSREQWS